MAGGASSSSSSPPFIFTYDAFLSFRGEDTRFGFTSNLYYALDHRGIYTFIDDRELGRGKEITPSLLTAIEESRIAIIVLSKKYASSSFCLDELAKIMECVKGKGRLVIPVFYDVDPSDVRKQTGTYGKALIVHENKFMANTENFNDNMERLRRWRMALKQVADLSGYHFKSGDGKYEFKFIAKIIEQVSIEIRHIALPVADHPVGLDSQVQNVISLLDVGSNNGVRVVGIHGIGGIGKTTLAVAVYNWVANRFADLSFEGLCFLENIREKSKKHGLEPLQMILLSELVGEQKIKLTSVGQGIAMLKHRLQRKKVLFVLDDVNQQQQLNALFGNHDWLESGSRVIITTRDMQLLSNYEDKITYELEKLNREDGLELLNWKAFKTNNVNQSYMDVLNDVVTYASGLPLALEVIGSHLLKKNLEEWKSALDQYKRSPHEEILTILKVSYDGLHELEKEIFLDITCFFGGCQLIDVKKILCAHHGVVSLDYGIGLLVEKSLIKIDRFDQVTSHNLIQEMGREIVCQESPKSPGERSRLWHLEDIVQIFGKNMGTDKIEIIYMDFPKSEKVIKWDGESFVKMRNLKTLIIHKAHFSQGAKHLPSSLRVLRWCRYPSYSLPSDFYPEELVILELSQTCLISIGFLDKRQFMSLTVIKLDESNIEEIPDISGAPNLEELSFISCQNLIKVHKSVGFLDKLKILCASYCRKLSSLPPIRSTSLGELHLIGCLSLENFPEILGEMKDIEFIDGSETSIKELPSSIENLTMLEQLVFENCEMLLSIPSSIVKLSRLQIMEIRGSEGLRFVKQHEGEDQGSSMAFSNAADVAFLDCNISDESIPIVLAWFRNVVDLDLAGNNFTVLPKSIEELCHLSNLTLDNCKKLREIRGIPPNIKYFSAANCTSLTGSSISMLLNKELHKDGDKLFHWPGGLIRYGNKMIHCPGSSMPKGFYHSSRQDSISFWFRNRRPAISLCVVAVCEADWMVARFPYELMINGNKVSSGEVYLDCCVEKVGAQYHTTIFDLLIGEDIAIVRSAINWYLAEIRFVSQYEEKGRGIKQIGMRVLKQRSSMEDISFTIPRCMRGNDADFWTYGMKLSLRPCWQEPLYSENLKSNLMQPASTSDAIRDEDQGCGIAARKRKRSTLMLDLNNEPDDTASEGGLLRYQSCELRLGGLHYEAIELPCYASPKMDSDSDSIMSSLASDTARKGGSDDDLRMYSMELSLPPCWQETLDCEKLESNLLQSATSNIDRDDDQGCGIVSRKRKRSTITLDLNSEPNDIASEEDQAVLELDFLGNTPAESSQVPSFAGTQNIQTLFLASSSEIVSGEELHLKTYCTVLPTAIDVSFGGQIDINQDDDVEMDGFYASLDAETHVLSCSQGHLSTNAPNEETREALKIVQDFITNKDASVFLDREQCNTMKSSLDYLSNLSSNGSLSEEMRALIPEASGVFTRCSSEYIEANMKIESSALELLRVDKLKADVEDNKSQFKEVVALEKELLQKLAEESKELALNMTRKRKRDIFEEGRALKTQMDKLRETVSYLQHEQDLAKETQAKIKVEWSVLREKCRKIVVEWD